MELRILVGKDLVTAEHGIVAIELEVLEFLLKVFLDRYESGVFAEHGTLAGFTTEFTETRLVEQILTLLALHCIYEDGLAE